MRFGVLGPVTVLRDGERVPLPAPMVRSLLGVLLLDAGRPVAESRLADALWGHSPPASAKASLQNHVLRLRRVLGAPDSERVRRSLDGYLIEAGPDELDLYEFEELRRRGSDSLEAGQWQTAADALSRALALWRGDPLADALPAVRDAIGVDRFQEARLQTVEWLALARLRLGRYDQVVADLAPLVREHPWREAVHGHLMHALHGTGRQAEALAVYQKLRAGLVAEFGVEPSARVAVLHQRILAADPVLTEPDRKVAVGTLVANVPLTANQPGHIVPNHLPPAPRRFIGREAELASVTEAMAGNDAPEQSGTTLLVGMPGVGKTALALTWAYRSAADFPDGRVHLDLNGFAASGEPLGSDSAVRILLDYLGVGVHRLPATPEGRIALFHRSIAGKRFLLILDNVRDAEQVRPLLPRSPALRALVASRHTLASLVTHYFARTVRLEPLTPRESLRLLRLRLGDERVDGHEAAVDRIAEHCAHLPLALVVAAGRAWSRPEVPLEVLAEQIASRDGGLDALDDGDPAVNVRALLSWSYRQLSESASRMFRLLGQHPAPEFSLATAAILAGVERTAARSDLTELASMNMIVEHLPGRYELHNLLRAFASEQAAAKESAADRRDVKRRVPDPYPHTAVDAGDSPTPLPAQSR